MALLYDDLIFLKHDTGRHPEAASRLEPVSRSLEQNGLAGRCRRPSWKPISRELLSHVHDLGYVDEVARLAERGGGMLDSDTVVSPHSYDVALSAAGAVADATHRVVAGEARHALCLVRPPGHHACRRQAMGFCLFNNIAVAARSATVDMELDRVLIVDWDVHHGNGTQDTFWTDERVAFLSIHRSPFYPGTGGQSETGGGSALGSTCNLPIRYGTSRPDYLSRFTRSLEAFADKVRPQLVMISAGFDTHHEDPVGSLGLETEDFITLTDLVLDVADQHAEGRVVSVLEGGYNPHVMPECVAVHLETMLARNSQKTE